MKTKIKLTEPLGFCYGVKRAVNLARRVLEDNSHRKVYSLGQIIHNKDAVSELSRKGLVVKNNLDGIKEGDILIISSHGVSPSMLEEAEKRGVEIVNATCPNVITSQRLCQRLRAEGYFVVIVGDKRHREIEALRGFAGRNNTVVKDRQEARSCRVRGKRIGVVVQTTQSRENLMSVLGELTGRNYAELRTLNTICNDTSMRQKAALNIAKKVDAMLVVGGMHSANTRRLFELCRKVCKKCYHIENDNSLRSEYLKNSNRIGLVSGASTPNWIIEGVLKKIERKEMCVTWRRKTKRK